MKKDELLSYLKMLGERLEAMGLHGEIILTGGAVMCIEHSARDSTKDIDALYEPKSEINRLIQTIADEYSLPSDWLNDSVKGFVGPNVESAEFASYGSLKISTVTPEYLLAMKLMSSRVEGQDMNDIRFLFHKLNITSFEEANSILTRFFPIERILPKTRYVIEEAIAEISEGPEQGSFNLSL
jgi:hypothetical protein